MALTIEIDIPPNTTVVLPDSITLQKPVGGHVAITLANETGETLSLAFADTATKFSAQAPATIADDDEDTIDLEVLAAGSILFQFASDEETITVETPAPVFPPGAATVALARRSRFSAMGRPAP